jgi:hypothetical protein
MWELDLKDKYIFKYIYDLIYIYREKEWEREHDCN